jgi:hypothetical protein
MSCSCQQEAVATVAFPETLFRIGVGIAQVRPYALDVVGEDLPVVDHDVFPRDPGDPTTPAYVTTGLLARYARVWRELREVENEITQGIVKWNASHPATQAAR